MVQDTLAIDNFCCANSHRKNIEKKTCVGKFTYTGKFILWM